MSYCKAAWNNVHIQPNGTTSPCCAWPNRLKFDRHTVQQQMQDNQVVEGCALCDNYQHSNQYSLRDYYNQKFSGDHIQSVDLSVDNVCNLQCVMCSSEYSHLNAHREKKFLGNSITGTTTTSNTVYKDIDWQNVKYLKLFGGEPTYSPGINKFLDWAELHVDFSHIHIETQTNNVVAPTQRLDALYRQCASVRTVVSMDGTHSVNNLIRQGTNSAQQFDYWESIPNAELRIHSAVGIYNALDVVAFQSWIQQHRPKWTHDYEMIQSPDYLNIQNMPESLKAEYAQHLMPRPVMDWMQQPGTDLYNVFYTVHHAMSQLYNFDLENANAVLHKYIQQTPVQVDVQQLQKYI